MSTDQRVARVIAGFWAALQGATGRGQVIPDETDVALAGYLAKHKIGVMLPGGEEAQKKGEDDMAAGRSIAEMIGEEITRAWAKLDAQEEGMSEDQWKVARGRIRGMAHAVAIMRSAPRAVTGKMIKEIEEEFHG